MTIMSARLSTDKIQDDGFAEFIKRTKNKIHLYLTDCTVLVVLSKTKYATSE